jgi:PEP-CTERM motif
MVTRFLVLVLAAAALLVTTGSTAFAWAEGSVITWGAPTNISGDSDVRTDGTLVGAFNMNGPDVTVNGVTFASFTYPFMATTATKGNFTFTESPGHMLAASGLGSTSPPFANLSSNYQTLLSTAVTTDDNNTLTLTITGLVLGHDYIFEFWTNGSNSAGTDNFRTTASAPNPVSLDDNTTNAIGGTGQFVVGSFHAADATEIITFTGTDTTQAPTINAFQLRDLSVVPEPGTIALLTIGSALGAFIRRKR